MRRVQPGNPSSPAKTGRQQAMGITTVTCRPVGNMIEIGQYLRIGHLHDQSIEEGLNIGEIIRIALTKIEFRRHGQIPFEGKAATKIANMFMYAKDFLNHQYHWQRATGVFWSCVIRRHAVALAWDRGFASDDGVFRSVQCSGRVR